MITEFDGINDYVEDKEPKPADTERLDFLERTRATVYRSITSTHWVFVDERTPLQRKGILGKTLREAIDKARGPLAHG